ncbi:MAG: DUF6473 family protein [Pseudomonadota bacterium]
MAWEHPGGESLDYQVCQYGRSRLLVRGPKVRLAPPYTVFFGGTETYGRFVAEPFAARIASVTSLRIANISCINAGVDAFAEDPSLLAVAAGAETVVIQVLGAANLSNEFYSVHPRRNDRFIRATAALTSLYPEVDFTEFTFTRHLLESLEARSPERFSTLVAAVKDQWRLQMYRLLSETRNNAVLLWIADTPPPMTATTCKRGRDPLFVDRDMVAELGARAGGVLEVIPTSAARAMHTQGMTFTDFEAHIASETLNAASHEEVAQALLPVLQARQRAA